jgi:isoleucyl-tRNA synthetase
VRQAILDLPEKESAERLLAGLNLVIKVEEKHYEILPDEVEVHATAKEGFAVATDGPYLAALVTTISQELFYEGLAREFVRRVQDQRKSLGLDIADRIRIYYQASEALSEAVKQNESYIAVETLALAVLDEALPHGLTQAHDAFDGEELHFALQTVQGVSA